MAERDAQGRFLPKNKKGTSPRQQVRVVLSGLEQFTESFIKKIALDVVANLSRAANEGGTPVDTGWARANWLPSVAQPIRDPAGSPENVPGAQAEQQAGLGKVLAYKLGRRSGLHLEQRTLHHPTQRRTLPAGVPWIRPAGHPRGRHRTASSMTSTIVLARESIYQRFVDNTTLGSSAFTFGNEKFKAPTDAPWARLTVNHEAGDPPTLGKPGDRKFLRRGRVLVQLYDSVDNGLRTLDLLAKATRDMFEGVTFDSLCFHASEIRETGDDGEWYQFIVDAPFDYYETK